jgi:phage-related protein
MQEGFQAVVDFFTEGFNAIGELANEVCTAIGDFFASCWEGICATFEGIGQWFSDVFQGAYDGVVAIWEGIKEFFAGVWDSIVETFSEIGTSIADAITGVVKGAINAVLAGACGIINGFIGAINACIWAINLIPGVDLDYLDYIDAPYLARGGILEKGEVGILEGNGAEAVVPLDQNKKWINAVATQMQQSVAQKSGQADYGTMLSEIVRLMQSGQTTEVNLNVGGQQFGRAVVNSLREHNYRTGGM